MSMRHCRGSWKTPGAKLSSALRVAGATEVELDHVQMRIDEADAVI
jgi:hypothetical protein